MPVIGTDCDVTLQHAAVNGGAAVGFIVVRDDKRGPLVRIERAAYLTPGGTWADRVRYIVRLLIGDSTVTPSGQQSTNTRAAQYALLQAFIAQRTGLLLTWLDGSAASLHASLDCLFESSFGKWLEAELRLNNGGFVESVPIDLVALNASYYDSGITYNQGYYR